MQDKQCLLFPGQLQLQYSSELSQVLKYQASKEFDLCNQEPSSCWSSATRFLVTFLLTGSYLPQYLLGLQLHQIRMQVMGS